MVRSWRILLFLHLSEAYEGDIVAQFYHCLYGEQFTDTQDHFHHYRKLGPLAFYLLLTPPMAIASCSTVYNIWPSEHARAGGVILLASPSSNFVPGLC